MEFRRQDEGYNHPPLAPPPLLPPPPPPILRESAFTRPSSLVVSPRGPLPTRNGAPSKNPDPVPPSAPPPPATPSSDADVATRYRECLRNHAAALGGHVLDGCGEFMSGAGGDAMKCAACSCHRSFHRKDSAASITAGEQSPVYRLLLPPPPPPLAHQKHFFPPSSPAIAASGGTTTESSSEELHAAAAAAAAAAVAQPSKKRHRTKFTAIQKERMLGFAERVNWRIQKQDEVEMERFCAEIGVSRQVLKVWMHNNKHSINRKPQLLEPQQQQQQQLHQQQQQT